LFERTSRRREDIARRCRRKARAQVGKHVLAGGLTGPMRLDEQTVMNKQSSSLILASMGLKGCALQAALRCGANHTRAREISSVPRTMRLAAIDAQNNVCAMQYQRSSFVPNSTIQPAFSLLHPLSRHKNRTGSAAADLNRRRAIAD
jgi:hypothetical protein